MLSIAQEVWWSLGPGSTGAENLFLPPPYPLGLDHQTVQAAGSLNLQNFITCDLWPHLLNVFR